MIREPSIHVTMPVFLALAKRAGIKVSKPKARNLFSLARGYSVDGRTLYIDRNKEIKKAEARISGSIQMANLAADIGYGLRIKRRHLGVMKLKQSDPQWSYLRELVPTLEIFCSNNKLEQRKGYLEFLSTGFDLMNKGKKVNYNYWPSWMLRHVDWINQTYESIRAIKLDLKPNETMVFMEIYATKVSEMSGIYKDYSKDPNEYVHFVHGRELSDKFGIDYETYIDAQFEALAFCNGIPRLIDIDSDKAEERLTKYVARAGIQLRSSLSEDTWADFKK